MSAVNTKKYNLDDYITLWLDVDKLVGVSRFASCPREYDIFSIPGYFKVFQINSGTREIILKSGRLPPIPGEVATLAAA